MPKIPESEIFKSVESLFFVVVTNVLKVVTIHCSTAYADQSGRLVGRLDPKSNVVAPGFVTRGLDARR